MQWEDKEPVAMRNGTVIVSTIFSLVLGLSQPARAADIELACAGTYERLGDAWKMPLSFNVAATEPSNEVIVQTPGAPDLSTGLIAGYMILRMTKLDNTGLEFASAQMLSGGKLPAFIGSINRTSGVFTLIDGRPPGHIIRGSCRRKSAKF